MRDLLALDPRDLAAANAPEPTRRGLPRRRETDVRSTDASLRSTAHSSAEAGETTTMIVVLVAWALIAGYLFAHVAEGAVMAAATPHVAAVAAPHPVARA